MRPNVHNGRLAAKPIKEKRTHPETNADQRHLCRSISLFGADEVLKSLDWTSTASHKPPLICQFDPILDHWTMMGFINPLDKGLISQGEGIAEIPSS